MYVTLLDTITFIKLFAVLFVVCLISIFINLSSEIEKMAGDGK